LQDKGEPLGEKAKEIQGENNEEQLQEDRGTKFRLTFSGPEDFRVETLANMLLDMSFFDYAQNQNDLAMKNYATQIWQEMGVFPDPRFDNRETQVKQAKKVIRALLTVRRDSND
jgi:hypothetical protein